uniref:Uncharacterized protein n=1 Tax=Nelumbo nucifera TaxID=4432 RepID=A0A822XTA3_NELNU|nr:TPA_asm: hypothetical protein HUJ06_024406 [Nelumbo nucifera]
MSCGCFGGSVVERKRHPFCTRGDANGMSFLYAQSSHFPSL